MRNPQWKIFLACELVLFVLAELPARQASGIRMRKRMIIDDANKLPSAVQEAASAVQQGTHHGPVDHGLPHTPQDMALVVHQPPNHDAGAYGRREDYERLGIVAHTGVAGPIVTRRKATNEILELLDPIHQDAVVMYEHELE